MSEIVWWIGALHLAAYAIVGTIVVVTLLTVKAHMMAGVMSKIIIWHVKRGSYATKRETGSEHPQ